MSIILDYFLNRSLQTIYRARELKKNKGKFEAPFAVELF